MKSSLTTLLLIGLTIFTSTQALPLTDDQLMATALGIRSFDFGLTPCLIHAPNGGLIAFKSQDDTYRLDDFVKSGDMNAVKSLARNKGKWLDNGQELIVMGINTGSKGRKTFRIRIRGEVEDYYIPAMMMDEITIKPR